MGDNDIFICVQTAAPLFPGCNVSHDLTPSQSRQDYPLVILLVLSVQMC